MTRARAVSTDAVHFGAIINRLRTERGWTLEAFGRYARMNPDYLGVLERGFNMPTLATILHLADVLGVEAAEIVRELENRA